MSDSKHAPSPDAIVRRNLEQASYDELADEYYDAKAHPTCYNLNRLSRLFLERQLPEP